MHTRPSSVPICTKWAVRKRFCLSNYSRGSADGTGDPPDAKGRLHDPVRSGTCRSPTPTPDTNANARHACGMPRITIASLRVDPRANPPQARCHKSSFSFCRLSLGWAIPEMKAIARHDGCGNPGIAGRRSGFRVANLRIGFSFSSSGVSPPRACWTDSSLSDESAIM